MIKTVEERYSSDFAEMLALLLSVDPESRPTYEDVDNILDNYWSCEEECKSSSFVAEDKDKGIIRNMVTVNSQQQSSLKPPLPASKGV